MNSSAVLLPTLPSATVGLSWRRRLQQQRYVAKKALSRRHHPRPLPTRASSICYSSERHEPSVELSGGMLEFLSFEGATALSTWQEAPTGAYACGCLRATAWTRPQGGYPTFVLCDGQNLFDDETSFAPQSW